MQPSYAQRLLDNYRFRREFKYAQIYGIMNDVQKKHMIQKANFAEYAIALKLACGARIGELLWRYVTIVLNSHCTPYPKSLTLTLTLTLTLCGLRSEFEETHGTPEHLKQVRNYNCVKLVQSVCISVSVPVSISASPLLSTLSPNRLDF